MIYVVLERALNKAIVQLDYLKCAEISSPEDNKIPTIKIRINSHEDDILEFTYSSREAAEKDLQTIWKALKRTS